MTKILDIYISKWGEMGVWTVRQVQQASAFLLVALAFGMGVMYNRWQQTPKEEAVFLLETVETKEATQGIEGPLQELKKSPCGRGGPASGGLPFSGKKPGSKMCWFWPSPFRKQTWMPLNLAAYLRDEQRIYVPYRDTVMAVPVAVP